MLKITVTSIFAKRRTKMNVETANRLQNLRKKNGYSQEELAEKIGISRQAVSKWERAEASPDTDNLILLARLYGVTLDELLNTESIPMPNSEGISLSKDYYTSTSDDGEIYPEGHPRYSAPNYGDVKPQTNANTAENVGNGGADNANGAENVGNSGQKSTVGDVVKAVAGAVGDAIDTTAASIREGKENAPKDGSDNGKSYADAFEKNFKGFGERMKTFGDDLGKSMDSVGKDIEKSMDKMGRDIDDGVKKAVNDNIPNHEQKPENIKYPATLLDKLYPIIVTAFFLFTVFTASWTTRYTWLVFLSVPVYYILSQCAKNLKYGVYDPLHALKGFLDGSLPIIVAFIYLAFGMVFNEWVRTLFLFGVIPVYYILAHNLFCFIDKKKSFGRAFKNFLDGSLPIIVTIVYLLAGAGFGLWGKAIPLFAIIPVYYIISSHYAKK